MNRKKLFPRTTKTELLLIQTLQKGRKANINAFISLRQYTEPQSVHDRRKSRYKNKAKILKDYEKL